MGSSFSSNEERDGKQRRFGCFGVSMMAHVGLLALLALAPQQAKEPFGQIDGNGAAGIEMNPTAATVADPAAAPAGESQAQYTEVLLADASDTTAVAVPEDAIAKPTEKTIETVEEQKLPEIQLAKAEIPMPAKALPKAAPKPVAAKSLPKAAKANSAETMTSDESDTHIQSALEAARKVQPEEELPPVPADMSAEDVAASDQKEEAPVEKTEEEKLAEFVPPAPTKEEAQPEEQPEPQPVVAAIPQQPAPQPQPVVQERPTQPIAQPAARVVAQPTTIASNSRVAGLNGGTGMPTQGLVANGATGSGQTGRSMGGAQVGVPLGVQIRDASDLVARPGNRPPPYPQQDRLLGRQGTTIVIGKVNSQGSVDEVILERSSGSRLMDQEAMRAFKQWKYMPGQQGFIRQPFKFALTGEAQELPARLRR